MAYNGISIPKVGNASRSPPILLPTTRRFERQPIPNYRPLLSNDLPTRLSAAGINSSLKSDWNIPLESVDNTIPTPFGDPGAPTSHSFSAESAILGRKRQAGDGSSMPKKRKRSQDTEHTKTMKRPKPGVNQRTNNKGKDTLLNDKVSDEDLDEELDNDDHCGLEHESRLSNDDIKCFACPFFRLDPHEYVRCGSKRLMRISDVTQHLRRYHRRPEEPYCPTCFDNFKQVASRDKHHKKCADPRPDEFFSKYDLDKMKRDLSGSQEEIRGRFNGAVPRTDDRAELQWFLIWDNHFSLKPVFPYRSHLMAEAADYLRHINQPNLEKIVTVEGSSLETIQDVAYSANPMTRPVWRPYRNHVCTADLAVQDDSISNVADVSIGVSPGLSDGHVNMELGEHDPQQSLSHIRVGSQSNLLAQDVSSHHPDVDNFPWGHPSLNTNLGFFSPEMGTFDRAGGDIDTTNVPLSVYTIPNLTDMQLCPQSAQDCGVIETQNDVFSGLPLDEILDDSLGTNDVNRPTVHEYYDCNM